MPYCVSEDMPEWDEYREWEDRGPGRGEKPVSLFKYIEPWQAPTAVLAFPATPGPAPQFLETPEHALWKVSGMAATCRAMGVKRVFGSYDGGGDESFTYLLGVEMSDGRMIPAALHDEAEDTAQLVESAVFALMDESFGIGPLTLQGVVIIDVDACTITDEKNADVVLGDKKPWEA
jgi:hypothetical protein